MTAKKNKYIWRYAAEIVGAVSLLWCFYPLIHYNKLPEIIPTHFNFAGEADGWSSRTTIFVLPIIALITYAGLTLLQRYPNIYNYPGTPNDNNREKYYSEGINLVRYIKILTILCFAYGANEIYSIAVNGSNCFGLGALFTPVVVLSFISVIVISCIRMSRIKKTLTGDNTRLPDDA